MEWKHVHQFGIPSVLEDLETFLSGMETDTIHATVPPADSLETFLSGMETSKLC